MIGVPLPALAFQAINQCVCDNLVGPDQIHHLGCGAGIAGGVGDAVGQGIGSHIGAANFHGLKGRAVGIVHSEHLVNGLDAVGMAHHNTLGGAGHDQCVMGLGVGGTLRVGETCLTVLVRQLNTSLESVGGKVVHQLGAFANGSSVGTHHGGVILKAGQVNKLIVENLKGFIRVFFLHCGKGIGQSIQIVYLAHVIRVTVCLIIDILPAQNLALIAGNRVDGAINGSTGQPVLNHINSALQLVVQVGSQIREVTVGDTGGQITQGVNNIPCRAGGQIHVQVGCVIEQRYELDIQFKIGDAQVVTQVCVDKVLNLIDLILVGDSLHGGEAKLNLVDFTGLRFPFFRGNGGSIIGLCFGGAATGISRAGG